MFVDEEGVSRCDECFIDLRMTGSHYHCGACGEVTGMMGHYFNPDGRGWRFICQEKS